MDKDEQAADNLSRFLLAEVTLGFRCNLTMAPQHPVKSLGPQVPVDIMHEGGLTTASFLKQSVIPYKDND